MGHEVAFPSPFGGLGPARSSLGTTQTGGSVATQAAPAVDPPAIRGGTRLLRQAIEAEADTFIEERRSLVDQGGHQRFVRNGYLPARLIQTCIGDIGVRLPRVRDLAGNLRFQSRILRPYQRRAHGDRQVFLAAYLRGFLTGDFVDALAALLGCSVLCLPTGVKIRLKALWHTEHTYWLDLLFSGTGYTRLRIDVQDNETCGCQRNVERAAPVVTVDKLESDAGLLVIRAVCLRCPTSWVALLEHVEVCGVPLLTRVRQGLPEGVFAETARAVAANPMRRLAAMVPGSMPVHQGHEGKVVFRILHNHSYRSR